SPNLKLQISNLKSTLASLFSRHRWSIGSHSDRPRRTALRRRCRSIDPRRRGAIVAIWTAPVQSRRIVYHIAQTSSLLHHKRRGKLLTRRHRHPKLLLIGQALKNGQHLGVVEADL